MAEVTKKINLKLTEAGKRAALSTTGDSVKISINLSRIAIGDGRYIATGNETKLKSEIKQISIVSGSVDSESNTVRFGGTINTSVVTPVYELGIFTDKGLLFALASGGTDPLFIIHPDIAFVAAFGVALGDIAANNITVVTDPNSGLVPAVLSQHTKSVNPHPQYLNASHLDVSSDPHPQYLELSRFQLLLDILLPIGYLHHTHSAANPKPKFDELLGIDTAWRRLEGKIIVGTDPKDSHIKDVGQLLGQKGMTTPAGSAKPHVYPLYTTNIFERYNPSEVIVTVWRVAANKTVINEGSNIRFTVTANNLPDGQILKWTVKEGVLNSGSNDIPKTDKLQNGSTILKNGSAIIDYVTVPDNNEADPLRHVRLTVGAPANLSMNIPIKDAGKNETIIHVTSSSYSGLVLDEYYKQQTGSYPKTTDTVRFIVNKGVYIVAKSTNEPAITEGTRWLDGSQLIVENHGHILGRGGNGGRSAYQYKFWNDDSTQVIRTSTKSAFRPPEKGANGGTAVKSLSRAIAVENHGVIAGGGGGGGGLGAYHSKGSYNFSVGGGGTGGGAPFGLRSPNEGTYTMYLQDTAIKDKKLFLPTTKFYRTLFQRHFGSLANWGGSRGDYNYPTEYNASNRNETRAMFVEAATNADRPAEDNFKKYRIGTNVGTLRPDGYHLIMSQSATLDKNGVGGSNLAPSPFSYWAAFKGMYVEGVDATKTKGGDGGGIGEAGRAGHFDKIYFYLASVGSLAKETTTDDTLWYMAPAAGGQAGYIKEGNVTIRNLASGTTKGR